MSRHVFVAMSGGVDSSVTAYLLKESGYEVSGIHMELSPAPRLPPEVDHADLERTCQLLQIPLHYAHFETDFDSRVIDYFCEEYSRGRTPNPCIRCNKYVKFGLLLEKITGLGGDFLATGHYARLMPGEAGYRLFKGVDSRKDQSYFLYTLGQNELARVLFPLGGRHKTEIKKLASELRLPAAARKESQDICFIPDNDSHAFIAGRVNSQPGDIVDTEGRIRGKHRGLAHYTIGQRQGIGISSREPLYVLEMAAETNRLIIGPQSGLLKNKIVVHNLTWISGHVPEDKLEIAAKVRYSSPAANATLQVQVLTAEVSFFAPQRAIAPGQSVVFYQGDEVLGGGIIGEAA